VRDDSQVATPSALRHVMVGDAHLTPEAVALPGPGRTGGHYREADIFRELIQQGQRHGSLVVGIQPKVLCSHDGVAHVWRDDDHASTRRQVAVDKAEQVDLLLGLEVLDEVRGDDGVEFTRVAFDAFLQKVEGIPGKHVQPSCTELAGHIDVAVNTGHGCSSGFELLHEKALTAAEV